MMIRSIATRQRQYFSIHGDRCVRQKISCRSSYAYFSTSSSGGNDDSKKFPTVSSSTTTTATPDASIPVDELKELASAKAAKVQNKCFFPWRHSPEPLDRLNRNHPDFQTKGPSGEGWGAGVDYFQILYVCKEMGIPLWKALLTTSWQDELSEQFAWSFNASVAALISGRFRVSMDAVVKEGENDSGSSTIDFEMNMDDSGVSISSTEGEELEVDVSINENNELLRGMLDEKLYDLYMGASEFGSKQMQVKLSTRPVGWRLVSGCVIPFVTREDVKRKPKLRGALRDLQDQFRSSTNPDSPFQSASDLGGFMNDARQWFQAETGHNEWRTIVMQIAINCVETFYVRDLKTNTIIQGNEHGVEQEVTHLVRFEMVTTEGGKPDKIPFFSPLGPPETRILGSWQITDWDDLLDGNVWYK